MKSSAVKNIDDYNAREEYIVETVKDLRKWGYHKVADMLLETEVDEALKMNGESE